MRIYCGSEDFVNFFEGIVKDFKLKIDYEIEDVDGEYEIVVKERED